MSTISDECVEMGGVWISGYYNKDGTRVESYCRKRKGSYLGSFSGFVKDEWRE